MKSVLWTCAKIDENKIDIRKCDLDLNFLGFDDSPSKWISMFLNLEFELQNLRKQIIKIFEHLPKFDKLDYSKISLDWKVLKFNLEYVTPINDVISNYFLWDSLVQKRKHELEEFRDYVTCETKILIDFRNYLIQFRSLYEIIKNINIKIDSIMKEREADFQKTYLSNYRIKNQLDLLNNLANYSVHFQSQFNESKSNDKIVENLKSLKESLEFPILKNDRNFYLSFVEKLIEIQRSINEYTAKYLEEFGLIFTKSEVNF